MVLKKVEKSLACNIGQGFTRFHREVGLTSEPGEKASNGRSDQGVNDAILALAKVLSPREEPKASSGFTKFLKGLVETLLPSLVMFSLGYIFIQGIELDLQREEFTAVAADKLRSYVETLMLVDGEVTNEKLQATALALGGFGGVATYPLVSIIEAGDEHRVDAAKSGLEQAGRIAPKLTCSILASVIDDATKTYSWKTQKAVVEVTGLVGCAVAEQPLKRLRKKVLQLRDTLTPEQVKNFTKVVDAATERIQAASQRSGKWF